MRLLICTGIFPPEIGGPATYSKTLAKSFIARGHEVRVITYSTPSLSSAEEGVIRITRSRFKPWHYYKYFRAVKKHGRFMDLIYAQDPVSSGYPSFLASKILKKPFAVKITGDYSWEQAMGRGLTDKLIDDFQKMTEHPSKIRRMRRIQINICREAKLVIVPSEYLKRLVSGWGVNPDKIKVIYNAVDAPQISLSKKEARNKLQISVDKFLVVSAGRNVKWKGFEVLKQVISELEAERLNINLQIMHEGSRQELLNLIRAADVFVLNTAYEGLPHVVIEAMALETPIITTNVCGNPEVVEDGQTGVLIEYNNRDQLRAAILKLMNDPDLRKKLAARAAVGIAEKFGFQKMIEETERTLLSCVS